MNLNDMPYNISQKVSAVFTCKNQLSKIANTECLLKSLLNEHIHPQTTQ